jgi:hypothetical protein
MLMICIATLILHHQSKASPLHPGVYLKMRTCRSLVPYSKREAIPQGSRDLSRGRESLAVCDEEASRALLKLANYSQVTYLMKPILGYPRQVTPTRS